MGGNEWFYVPKVWSPAGGWWSNPTHWKRNTSIVASGIGLFALCVISVSSANEHRPIPPLQHIPSQYWCKHAIEEDPKLQK